MLNLLIIRNFALIESLELEPAAGFTVLTGETGAGKSIVLSALNLLLGGKAATDLIRQGEEQAQVEALFIPPARLRENPEQGELVLKRVVSREGRNRVQINGSLSTLSSLAELAAGLVSLCGQHEQQTLLRPEEHLLLLDAFAGLSQERKLVGKLVGAVQGLDRELAELTQNLSRQEERRAWLSQVIKELEEAKLNPVEEAELLEERKLLANAGQRADLSQEAYYCLYGADKGSALSSINRALTRARQLAEIDSQVESLVKALEEGYYSLEDAAYSLRDYHGKVALTPGRLDWIEERLSVLQRLTRRHGGSVEAALSALAQAKEELAALEGGEERLAELQQKRQRALSQALGAARALSQKRAQAAPEFAAQVVEELKDLGMSACLFEARLSPPSANCVGSAGGPLNRRGLETVEFYLAPNPGEGFRPLARTASGGELSRILLALRGLTARELGSPTLIFDEVDAGIGGDIGLAVGRKLAALAQNAQVICITHLPQIAAFASCHFKVSKQVSGGRTATQLTRLDDAARLAELARMLGSGQSALNHAQDLLQSAARL